MHTPNIDKMAERGIVFEKAFVQQAVCSPSRVSMMTGRRPDTTKVMDLDTYFRDVGANFTTIPQFFKQQGYKSINVGKMFHRSGPGGDDDISWTEKYVAGGAYRGNGDSWEAVPQGTQLVDTLEADYVIERLAQLAPEALAGEKNFFLGWGLRRPHLPFLFPEQFAEFYPEEDIQLPENPWAPEAMPNLAWSGWNELRTYSDIAAAEVLNPSLGEINVTLPDQTTKDLRRAYYAPPQILTSFWTKSVFLQCLPPIQTRGGRTSCSSEQMTCDQTLALKAQA